MRKKTTFAANRFIKVEPNIFSKSSMATKKILGLDLGVGSIGWAVIEETDNKPQQILSMGSRIVPLSKDDSDQFQKGQAITKNADRTAKRTARKGFDRYQLRRFTLTQVLRKNEMLPERMDEHVADLWKLRSDAATPGCKLTLKQIGRVLYHINQKRGYKHSKADEGGDANQTKYVAAVNQRFADLQQRKQTIGQYFYQQLVDTAVHTKTGEYFTFRIKEQVYPRQAYMAEFDQIMAVQKDFYPGVITDELIDTLRNRIIFYQRPLKSCKHLVSLCEFEMKPYKNQQGKIVYSGPKVAPRTSPLAQLCTLWETVNNIAIDNRDGEKYQFTFAERKSMVDFLCEHEKMTATDLQKLLGFTKKDGWRVGKNVKSGIKGFTTRLLLREALGDKYDTERFLKFDIPMHDTGLFCEETGEIYKEISPSIEQQPLYRLWHLIYSVQDPEELKKALEKQFGITDDEVVQRLFKIDFVKPGYANKSHKFIRRILPMLMNGYMYSEACAVIGVNHSHSLTKTEQELRPLQSRLTLLQKNELRQPIVEKILNQMINVVNALLDKYGNIDEVRIEMARELKMTKEERNDADKRNRDNERQNSAFAQRIKELGITPTRTRIQKYKMWEESQHQCFYCGKMINVKEFMTGADFEIEHIIPRSVLFDDSFSNKVCACRECNKSKNNRTAIEFMESKTTAELEAYKNRVDEAYQSKRISKTKRDHLLWHMSDIPADFIDRQLRQSQYIACKAMEILQTICREVHATGGSITDFLRHQWGYDEILHTLNFQQFKSVGLTEVRESDNRERICNWSKRMDHRHHAVDALTIAQTSPTYIKRLNTLNASREIIHDEIKQADAILRNNEKRSMLAAWVQTRNHISVKEATQMVDSILISFRAGKKVTTPGKRYTYEQGKRHLAQAGLLIPRGQLTEETVYGITKDNQFVVRYPLATIDSKTVGDIVDPTIRHLVEARLQAFGGKSKEAFAMPLYSDPAQTMAIKSVRCYTGLKESSMTPVQFDSEHQPVGYSKTGNNHHVAIYQDAQGKFQEIVVPFKQAVQRKQMGLPVVIEEPQAVLEQLKNTNTPKDFLETLPHDDWKFVISLQANEMLILGMEDADYQKAIQDADYHTLNKHLYRVQKLATKNYCFRYHTETSVDDKYNGEKNEMLSKQMKKLILIQSLDRLWMEHPHKVQINLLGEIVPL